MMYTFDMLVGKGAHRAAHHTAYDRHLSKTRIYLTLINMLEFIVYIFISIRINQKLDIFTLYI